MCAVVHNMHERSAHPLPLTSHPFPQSSLLSWRPHQRLLLSVLTVVSGHLYIPFDSADGMLTRTKLYINTQMSASVIASFSLAGGWCWRRWAAGRSCRLVREQAVMRERSSQGFWLLKNSRVSPQVGLVHIGQRRVSWREHDSSDWR